jgi:uncharacterized protein (TIGR03089 family)
MMAGRTAPYAARVTRTFPAVLAHALRDDPGRPLVTFYDDSTGERVELSVATYATWVAKTAALLADELDVERGDLVLVDLPTHWLGPVWLGAAWTLGAVVTDDLAAVSAARVVVCGPETLDGHAASGRPVVALSLLPMAARLPGSVPAGVVDYGAVVWGQPDVFVAVDPPGPDDGAWRSGTTTRSQEDLLRHDGWTTERTLTDLDPCSEAGAGAVSGPAAQGGGVVWVRHPDPALWDAHASSERATAQVRR